MERLTERDPYWLGEEFWTSAREPIKVANSGVRYTDEYVCPNCDRNFTGTGVAKFCYHCGQRIKWED